MFARLVGRSDPVGEIWCCCDHSLQPIILRVDLQRLRIVTHRICKGLSGAHAADGDGVYPTTHQVTWAKFLLRNLFLDSRAKIRRVIRRQSRIDQ